MRTALLLFLLATAVAADHIICTFEGNVTGYEYTIQNPDLFTIDISHLVGTAVTYEMDVYYMTPYPSEPLMGIFLGDFAVDFDRPDMYVEGEGHYYGSSVWVMGGYDRHRVIIKGTADAIDESLYPANWTTGTAFKAMEVTGSNKDGGSAVLFSEVTLKSIRKDSELPVSEASTGALLSLGIFSLLLASFKRRQPLTVKYRHT